MTEEARAPEGQPQGWRKLFTSKKADHEKDWYDDANGPAKWSMGVLNDKKTVEVPGSVLLLASDHNEPLGLRVAPARTSHSSLPTGLPRQEPQQPAQEEEKKRTGDGKIILEPQPDDSENDPLNWPAWRRDTALLSLGLFCMVGGGMTPLLAAGFTNVAQDYDVQVSKVSLTTGLFMMGMGIGSVIFSPTAILFGKRPVYLFGSILFILTSAWCALSPNFLSLLFARIFQGIAVSPVECLPSATIAEIFFLHERAFRIGTYTLLLLGGKNLVPLVSAAVIQRLGWRWVFWIVAIVVAFCGTLLFLFVPETFWDRTPVPKKHRKSTRPSFFHRYSHRSSHAPENVVSGQAQAEAAVESPDAARIRRRSNMKNVHVGFAPGPESAHMTDDASTAHEDQIIQAEHPASSTEFGTASSTDKVDEENAKKAELAGQKLPQLNTQVAHTNMPSSFPPAHVSPKTEANPQSPHSVYASQRFERRDGDIDSENQSLSRYRTYGRPTYTNALRDLPAKSFVQQLKPFHGRLNHDKWHKVMIRPFVLYTYPSVLWSAAVYSCSVGWLIVISEAVAVIYRDADSYNFNALQTGLVYLSPFIGGVLGTAVAGKVSDVIVKAMARRNGGLYEPEFRLVMVIPVAITTVIGLMGFGWSAQERDAWIVPTVFFGIVSFGCSLGSTTSITFCVDSYRQYAGEALVTLNFSKNIFHGLVFSLFVTGWITSEGPKDVFIWIGVIQLIVLFSTIPMFIFGKRARMWTVRRNFVEKW